MSRIFVARVLFLLMFFWNNDATADARLSIQGSFKCRYEWEFVSLSYHMLPSFATFYNSKEKI